MENCLKYFDVRNEKIEIGLIGNVNKNKSWWELLISMRWNKYMYRLIRVCVICLINGSNLLILVNLKLASLEYFWFFVSVRIVYLRA